MTVTATATVMEGVTAIATVAMVSATATAMEGATTTQQQQRRWQGKA